MKVEQVCEYCYKEKANSITHDKDTDRWVFCCQKCLAEGYCINFDRLNEEDWIERLDKKGWVDMAQFTPRYLWAKKFCSSK